VEGENFMDTASLMITTYNRLALTKRMLESLFITTTSPYHLIIVDNGSTDGTVDWLHTLNDNAQKRPSNCISYDFYYNKENRGIAVGRNQGLKIANKYNDSWLSTLDNDVEMPLNWLNDCIGILKANPKYAVGVNMENVSYPLITQQGKTFQFKVRGNLGTACTVFSRELHNKLGYFVDTGSFYSHEDADFFFRARTLGYNMAYLQENGVHFGEGDLDVGEYREFKTQQSKDNLANFQKNCYDYMSKVKPIYIPFDEEITNE
jgi:GT2 family glycosyltransferase